MYIDYKTYLEFENEVSKLKGQFLSPGGVGNIYGVTRAAVYNWIVRDNVIMAHRYAGPQGSFIAIPIEELEKIDKLKNKEQIGRASCRERV